MNYICWLFHSFLLSSPCPTHSYSLPLCPTHPISVCFFKFFPLVLLYSRQSKFFFCYFVHLAELIFCIKLLGNKTVIAVEATSAAASVTNNNYIHTNIYTYTYIHNSWLKEKRMSEVVLNLSFFFVSFRRIWQKDEMKIEHVFSILAYIHTYIVCMHVDSYHSLYVPTFIVTNTRIFNCLHIDCYIICTYVCMYVHLLS